MIRGEAHARDRAGRRVFWGLATVALVLCVSVLVALFAGSMWGLRDLSTLIASDWTPHAPALWPLVVGTLVTTAIAVAVAIPIGLLAAIYLSEFASHRVRHVAKPIVELIAGIPTVVFGYLALVVITPVFATIVPDLPAKSTLSAGLALGLMITPTLFSLADDALQSVPRPLREGAMALGADRVSAVTTVILPSAAGGLAAAVLLALGRGMGESMIVAIAAGDFPMLSLDVRQSMDTLASHILDAAQAGATSHVYTIAGFLFFTTWATNALALRLRRRRG